MAVTIKTNARGWREVSTTAYWTAHVVHDTGSALYAVVQDTGATPKVRVMKADSRGIKPLQRDGILYVVEKESRLVRNAFERKGLDPQT